MKGDLNLSGRAFGGHLHQNAPHGGQVSFGGAKGQHCPYNKGLIGHYGATFLVVPNLDEKSMVSNIIKTQDRLVNFLNLSKTSF